MKLVQIPAIYLEAIRFPFTSDTLVWPYYVSDVNFVSDWIYVPYLFDFRFWHSYYSFFVAISVMWGCLANCIIDVSILPHGYVFTLDL